MIDAILWVFFVSLVLLVVGLVCLALKFYWEIKR